MRKLLLALGLLLLPAALAAQGSDPAWRSRVGLTAFTGARVPYTTGFISVTTPGGEPLLVARQQRGGAPVLGAEGEYRLLGRLSLVAAGVYTRTGRGDFVVGDSANDERYIPTFYDGDTFLARGGLALRFESPRSLADERVRPSTDLFAGGGVVRELNANHPALSVGFKGSLPIARGVELAVGLEDYFVFWNTGSMERWMEDQLYGASPEGPVLVNVFYDTSNILMLRAGFTFRP